MTTRNEEDELFDETSSQPGRDDDDLSAGTSSDVAPFENSSQATSSGNSSEHNSFELFGFTKDSATAVCCTRWIFLGALLVAAAGLATGVFITLDNEQYRDFTVEVSPVTIRLVYTLLSPSLTFLPSLLLFFSLMG